MPPLPLYNTTLNNDFMTLSPCELHRMDKNKKRKKDIRSNFVNADMIQACVLVVAKKSHIQCSKSEILTTVYLCNKMAFFIRTRRVLKVLRYPSQPISE